MPRATTYFFKFALIILFSFSIVFAASEQQYANQADPAVIHPDNVFFQTIEEYNNLPLRAEPTEQAKQEFDPPQGINGEGLKQTAGEEQQNEVLNSGWLYYDFGYWNGYQTVVGDATISPYLYSYYAYYQGYYAYNWQPTTITFSEPAESVSFDFWYYGTLYAYDTNGNYLGYAQSWGYGWNAANFTAAPGTSIGSIVVQNTYYAYDYFYTRYMSVHYANNQAPTADAGANQSFDCVVASQDVTLDGSGSSDPDGDALSYTWTGSFGSASGSNPTVTLGGGSHVITLTVDDGNGGSASATTTVTVNLDIEAPVMSLNGDATVYVECPTPYSEAGVNVTDCNSFTLSTTGSVGTALGSYTLVYTAVDAAGNTASLTRTVVVQDTQAPEIEAPADMAFEANTSGGWAGDFGTALAVDACDDNPAVTHNAPAVFPLGDTEVTWTATDASGNAANASQIVSISPYTVTVDIKPGSDNNSVNPRSNGVIPVAILSDTDFDATGIDVSSLAFGPNGAGTAHNGHIEDVDGDGDDDLMLHFRTRQTGVSNGDTELCLEGLTSSGIPIAGCDYINGNGLARPIADGDNEILPTANTLEQNYPNPFNPATHIDYGLAADGMVSLNVYDLRGAQVGSLVQAYQSAGYYSVSFDASNLSSGTYLYVLTVDGERTIKRFSLMK